MEHREWFAPEEDKDYIKSLLSTHTGIIWKAIESVSGQTAGLFIVVFPGKSKFPILGCHLLDGCLLAPV